MVDKGTKVVITREPVKIGQSHGRIYMQVHDDPDFEKDYLSETNRLLEEKGLPLKVDREKVKEVLQRRNGIPIDVSVGGTFSEDSPRGE